MSFFVAIAELAQEPPDGIRMGPHTSSIEESGGQLRHGDVAILPNDLGKQGAVRIQCAFALWPPLRCGASHTRPPDREPPKRTRRRRYLQLQRRRAPTQSFFNQALKPRPKSIWLRC